MSEPFIGEIRMFAGNFAPRGWAFCDGQSLSIAQYSALFSLLGTIYGGDGRTDFRLPDLRGRAPIHQGQGPGLTNRLIGSRGGTETVTLTTAQIPAHTHELQASASRATSKDPTGKMPASTRKASYNLGIGDLSESAMETDNTGGNQPHNNMQPFLPVQYIIALIGIYPSRS